MKIALLALSAAGAMVCIIFAVALIRQGRPDLANTSRVIGSGIGAVVTFLLAGHPEWKRYLEEKF